MHEKKVRRRWPRSAETSLSCQQGRKRSIGLWRAGASETTRRMTGAAGLVIGLALTTGVAPARAGTYLMSNCNVPGAGSSLLHPWEVAETLTPESFSVVDGCSSGDGVSFHMASSVAGRRDSSILLVRPTGARSAIKFVKLVLWYAARLSGSGQPIHFVSTDLRADGTLHYGLSDAPPGSENVIAEQQLSAETRTVRLALRCGVPGSSDPVDPPCAPANSVPLLIRGMEVTLSEDLPPIVLPPSGSLLEGGSQSGIRTLNYAASDAQSGLRQIDVLLGNTVVASQDLASRCPHADFTVCPVSDGGTLQIDTRTVPNGSHRVAVRVIDAAGNERFVHGESPVEVANVPTTPAAPATIPDYVLSAHFKGTSRTTITVPHGRRVSLSGRLTQGAQPLPAGTELKILERLDRRGAREVPRGRVKTRAGGLFSAILARTRPSRRVRVAYREPGGRLVVSLALRIRVRAASYVRASLRGRAVRFSGRVLSGPMPKRGKLVLMEGRAPGSAWTTFASLRTDLKGRFSGRYRLRVRRPGVKLKIRALVRSEGGYGYLSSRSRAVTLRVR